MQKIAIIGPAHPLRGGLATFNERLARQLQSEGDRVHLYTFSLQYPSFLFPGTTQYSSSLPPHDLDISVSINSINPLSWWKVGKTLQKAEFDLIIVRYWLPFMGPCLGTILRIAKKNKSTRVVAITDNVIPHEKRPGDKWFTQYFMKAIDKVVAMSAAVLLDAKKFTDVPTGLVKHPLYDNFGTKLDKQKARAIVGIPEGVRVFLFFGFIRKYKGLDLLIAACDLYDLKKNKAVLVIAGEFYAGEDEIKEQLAKSTSKNEIIAHTQFIADEEVGIYMSAADVVVQPYRSATQSGVTPLAYHFEVPMIVTNVGALPDMVPSDIGLVCEPTAVEIAKSMEDFESFDLGIFSNAIKKEKAKYDWSHLSYELKSNATNG